MAELYEEKDTFVIDTDEKADWAIKKIKERQQDVLRWTQFYNTQIQKIKAAAENDTAYLIACLQEFFAQVPRKETKTTEKYVLPSGELVLQKAGMDYERDNDQLLAWCRVHAPQMIRTKVEPAWADVKAYIKKTGEIPEGVEVIEKPAEFKVR